MSVYRVAGTRAYRGHNPGETFEAVLDERVEERAITRGNIVVVRRSTPSLTEGSYQLPKTKRKAKGGNTNA